VRFPFGRGARQRELEGLRQRIAELQDEISKIQDSLDVEVPDVETTDAYRSVQLLRESMRREELATLHAELRGLEARVESLTAADRRPSLAEESEASADADDITAPGRHELEPTAIPAAEPRADEGPAGPPEAQSEAAAPRSPITGQGLPSERAIIEPALSPRPAPPAEADAEEPSEAEAEIETPAEAAVPVGQEPAAESAASLEPPSEGEPAAPEAVAAPGEAPEPAEAQELEPSEPVAVDEPTPAAPEEAEPAVGKEAETQESGAVAEPEPAEVTAGPADTGAEADDGLAAPVGHAEDDDRPAPEAAGRRSSRWILLLLAIAVVVIAGVLALESGLIGPITGSAPGIVATPLATRPPTVAPTARPPTAISTLPPTSAPPTVPPLAAVPDEAFTVEGLTLPDSPEISIERGTIAAPPGFTGALLRDTPILAARNLQFLPNGALVDILPGSATGSGFSWLRVRSAEGVVGWVISTVLGR